MVKIKSAAIVFTEKNSIDPYIGFSNEILCIFAAQGTANVPNVKVLDLKIA